MLSPLEVVSSEVSLVEVVSSDVSDKNKYILLVSITNNSSKYLLKYPKALFLSVPPDHFLLRNLPPSGRFEKPLEAARLGGAPILSPADPCTYLFCGSCQTGCCELSSFCNQP